MRATRPSDADRFGSRPLYRPLESSRSFVAHPLRCSSLRRHSPPLLELETPFLSATVVSSTSPILHLPGPPGRRAHAASPASTPYPACCLTPRLPYAHECQARPRHGATPSTAPLVAHLLPREAPPGPSSLVSSLQPGRGNN